MWADPQQVRILDNSTGLVGHRPRRDHAHLADQRLALGPELPEIWHNDDGIPQRGLPVTCRIAAGREESDFYIALGVVGQGARSARSAAPTMIDTDGDGVKETFIGSTLDGQPHHGWKTDDAGNPTGTNFGLFQSAGNDPAGATTTSRSTAWDRRP